MANIIINTAANSIEVSKKFAAKASHYGSEEYKMLRDARADYPGFKVVEVARKAGKSSTATYKGLTYEYMETYIAAHDNDKKTIMTEYLTLRGETNEAIEAGMASQTYMAIKVWFLEQYPDIATFHETHHKVVEEAMKKQAAARAKLKEQKRQERINALLSRQTA